MPKTFMDIQRQFERRWSGTTDELMAAMEDFYEDIMHSVKVAAKDRFTTEDKNEVDDYMSNVYFG